MTEIEFGKRLGVLRKQKGVSAREMSLALGQNESYINRIENGKAYPSMQVFFYICEYFEISPQEFFDPDNTSPELSRSFHNVVHKLSGDELTALDTLLTRFKEL